jgi:hypothetical protein
MRASNETKPQGNYAKTTMKSKAYTNEEARLAR